MRLYLKLGMVSLLALSGLGLFGIVSSWSYPPDPTTVRWVTESITLPEPQPTSDVATLRQRESYRLIAQRPLFSENRKPWTADSNLPIDVPPTDPKLSNFGKTVSGTITSPNNRIAFVRDHTTGHIAAMREGAAFFDQMQAWLVQRIDQDRVQFLKEEDHSSIEVFINVAYTQPSRN